MSTADDVEDPITNEAALGLPPLSEHRRGVWTNYRLEFLPDGYPGRRTGEQLSAHPLYGNYVVADYLAGYRRTRDPAYLDAARRVADAALARMEAREDALVFTYEPGTGISSLPHRFYSGLTQARYLSTFGRLHEATGEERYREAARAVLRSLLIPVERGGVARTSPGGGAVIEEYTHDVPDYTLNGWTTATLLIGKHADDSGDEEARQLFLDSCRGIRDVLPLYDVAELRNSRYRLGGPARIRFVFSRPGARMTSAEVVVPGQGTYPVKGRSAQRWENRYLEGIDGEGAVTNRVVAAEVFLSRVTWPTPNRISARVTVPEDASVSVLIGEGEYDPLVSRLSPSSDTTIDTLELRAGENDISVPVPWTTAELVAYPTNFGKKLGGRNYNAYHFIHIDTLGSLAERTGDDMFGYFADRWSRYVERWPEMPVYTDAAIALDRYDDKAPGRPAPPAEVRPPARLVARRVLGRVARAAARAGRDR